MTFFLGTHCGPISVIAKLFEELIYNQSTTFSSDNNILVEQQYGFPLQQSTETALLGSTNECLYKWTVVSLSVHTVDYEILWKTSPIGHKRN